MRWETPHIVLDGIIHLFEWYAIMLLFQAGTGGVRYLRRNQVGSACISQSSSCKAMGESVDKSGHLLRASHVMQVQDSADVSLGGIMLPDSAKEKPIAGRVVRVGPGKREKDGSRKAPKLKEGDAVLYFKWAGDQMETPSGEKYVVVHESDVLCKT